jgi:hypothetical protein
MKLSVITMRTIYRDVDNYCEKYRAVSSPFKHTHTQSRIIISAPVHIPENLRVTLGFTNHHHDLLPLPPSPSSTTTSSSVFYAVPLIVTSDEQ